jgi:hypothetical protein
MMSILPVRTRSSQARSQPIPGAVTGTLLMSGMACDSAAFAVKCEGSGRAEVSGNQYDVADEVHRVAV